MPFKNVHDIEDEVISENRTALHDLAEDLRHYIEDLKRSGYDEDMTLSSGLQNSLSLSPAESLPVVSLSDIRTTIGNCTRCKLHQGRTNIVFGVGNPAASLVFVGEAPGRDEDLKGEPFVGRAGKLLTDIIGAIGLSREEVYICNVIKCRPPENRNPEPDEIEQCEPFLKSQLDSIKPKIICALGKFAAQLLLRTETPISKLRGKFWSYNGIPVMPTYHPAYLLRNPSSKKEVWEDMKLVHAELTRLTGRNLVRKGK